MFSTVSWGFCTKSRGFPQNFHSPMSGHQISNADSCTSRICNALSRLEREGVFLFPKSVIFTVSPLFKRFQKQPVGVVSILHLILVPQRGEKTFEGGVVISRNLKGGQHAAEVRSMIAIVEQADVPASTQRI